MYKIVKVCDDGYSLDVNNREGQKVRFSDVFKAECWLFQNVPDYWEHPYLYYTEWEEAEN